MISELLTVDQLLDNKYRIEAVLGRGGTGIVYRARHLELSTHRAIKVLHQDLADNVDVRRRFRNEAKLAEELRHPNLVRLYDLSSLPDGSFYIVWEYVDGDTLASLLKKGVVFSPGEVADLVGRVADGMAVAHGRNVLHRDLSPDNLMICVDGEGRRTVKVLDFGLAKIVGNVTESGTTEVGVYLGKIGYSSPEQVGVLEEDEQLDPRTDVFSLAVVAYRMLVGKLPFRTSNVQTFLFDLTTAPEERVRERLEKPLPAAWRKPLSRALRRSRSARTPSMEALKKDVEQAARKSSTTRSTSPSVATPVIGDRPQHTGGRSIGRMVLLGTLLALPFLGLLAWIALRPVASRGLDAQQTTVPAVPMLEPAPEPIVTREVEELRSEPVQQAQDTERSESANEETVAEAPVESEVGEPLETTPDSEADLPEVPTTGILVVESTPPAAVTVDGEAAGQSPIQLELEPGFHDVLLTSATGARSWHKVNVVAGESSSVSSRLDVFGSLAITSEIWAEVNLDGRPAEQTPAFFRRVPAGQHRLRVGRSGYKEQILEVYIEEGKTTNVQLKMEEQR